MDISKLKEIRDRALSVKDNVPDVHKWEEEICKEDGKLISSKSKLSKSMDFPVRGSPEYHNEIAKEEAMKCKDEGNRFFKVGKYKQAVGKYTEGLKYNEDNLLLSNRAMANLKLCKYEEAVNDCTKSLAIDSNFLKSYLRRGSAYMAMNKNKMAIRDYEKALELQPNNNEAKSCLKDLRERCKVDIPIESMEMSLISDLSTAKLNKDAQNQEKNSTGEESACFKDSRKDSIATVKEENDSDDEYFCGPQERPEGCSDLDPLQQIKIIVGQQAVEKHLNLSEGAPSESRVNQELECPENNNASEERCKRKSPGKADSLPSTRDNDSPNSVVSKNATTDPVVSKDAPTVFVASKDATADSVASKDATKSSVISKVVASVPNSTDASLAVFPPTSTSSQSEKKVQSMLPPARIPTPPRTSHHFELGWQRCEGDSERRFLYLKSCLDMLSRFQFSLDLLGQIVRQTHEWLSDSVPLSDSQRCDSNRVGLCRTVVGKLRGSRGFGLACVMLDDDDKKRLEQVDKMLETVKLENASSKS